MFSISRSGSGQVQRVYTWRAGIQSVHAYVVQNGVEQDGDSCLICLIRLWSDQDVQNKYLELCCCNNRLVTDLPIV